MLPEVNAQLCAYESAKTSCGGVIDDQGGLGRSLTLTDRDHLIAIHTLP